MKNTLAKAVTDLDEYVLFCDNLKGQANDEFMGSSFGSESTKVHSEDEKIQPGYIVPPPLDARSTSDSIEPTCSEETQMDPEDAVPESDVEEVCVEVEDGENNRNIFTLLFG